MRDSAVGWVAGTLVTLKFDISEIKRQKKENQTKQFDAEHLNPMFQCSPR